MNLENIKLLVPQEEVINKKYRHYYVALIGKKLAIFANGSAVGTLTKIAIAKNNEVATKFCGWCNHILNQLLANEISPWRFVEEFYPNYHSCQDIAENNDLSKIVNGENDKGDCSDVMLKKVFKGKVERAEKALVISNARIYERAIEGFIQQHPQLLLD